MQIMPLTQRMFISMTELFIAWGIDLRHVGKSEVLAA